MKNKKTYIKRKNKIKRGSYYNCNNTIPSKPICNLVNKLPIIKHKVPHNDGNGICKYLE